MTLNTEGHSQSGPEPIILGAIQMRALLHIDSYTLATVMQQVKDLSVTKLVSSCFQEKHTHTSPPWHIRSFILTLGTFPHIHSPYREAPTNTNLAFSDISHTLRHSETMDT